MDIFGNIFSWLTDNLRNVLSWIVSFLPASPFKLLELTPLKDILGYINYFLPMDFILSSLTAWGSAILIYYAYHIILRWVKAVE